MKITRAYLKQLIKEEMSEGMTPKDAILGAFSDKGMSTENMVNVLHAIANLNLSSIELNKAVQEIANEVSSSGDGSVLVNP